MSRSASASPRSEFLAGAFAALPATAAVAPFAILLGALAAEKGLSSLETGLMSAIVFAGSAQFAALDTWTHPAAAAALAVVVLVVNLRHVLMSASIRRKMDAFPRIGRVAAMLFLADEIWAFAEMRAARRPLTPAYFAGLVAPFYSTWIAASVAGGLIGRSIAEPHALGLDFAFIAIFIALIAGFRKRPWFLPTLAASAAAAVIVRSLAPGPIYIAAGAIAGCVAAAIGPWAKETEE